MARSTRSAQTPDSKPKAKATPKASTKKTTPKAAPKGKAVPKSKAKSSLRAKPSLSTEPPSPTQSSSEDDDNSEDAYEEQSTAETEPEEEEEDDAFSEAASAASEIDSDNLDADSDAEDETPKKGKRKSTGGAAKGGSAKKTKYDPDGKNLREVEQLEKVPGPTTDPKTKIILPSTLDFLRKLMQPGHNDRDWFQQHDALYRHALANYNTFLEALVPVVSACDWQVPELPIKDLTHRIYRDVRFSKSKIPYKTNLGATFSRTGRKTDFGMYYTHIQPGGGSILAGGVWQPEGHLTKKFREAFLTNPAPFRKVIGDPKFAALFGEPKARKGRRNSVFGADDELKNKPKMSWNGAEVTKDHPDIDLLKLKTIAVSCRFEDEEVLSENFISLVEERVKVLVPFVQIINDMIDGPQSDAEGGDEEEEGDGGEDEEGEDAEDEDGEEAEEE